MQITQIFVSDFLVKLVLLSQRKIAECFGIVGKIDRSD